jgi:hypothetical protein
MQRKLGLCGLVLCAILLAGCGGGTGNSSNGSTQNGLVAKSSLGDESSPTAETNFGALADERLVSSDAKELSSIVRPLARSPFGFARNGQFHVYAANGSRKRLQLDFDTKSYAMMDSLGQATSGTFSEDAMEPGTYIFASDRITGAANTARFRITADAVVGSFPFEKPWSNPVSYQVMPFVAARAFVTDPAQLDGIYNRFGISRKSDGASDSQILQMQISGGGNLLQMCVDNVIYNVDACPTASKRVYNLTASPDSYWTATNNTDANDWFGFRIARIGGQPVWLSGGPSNVTPDTHVFRIGLRDSANWPTARFIGAATEPSWGSQVLDTSASVRSFFSPDGVYETLNLPVTGIVGPTGIRIVNGSGVQKYFGMQNGTLAVTVGARNPNTQGYILISLVDSASAPDPRNGRYKVFATNGTRQWLALNMDTQRYEMTDNAGAVSAGAFSADAAEPGTYVFASDRMTATANTARFRVTQDTVVGAFPFAVTQSATTSYAPQPFVASRALETTQTALDGAYNRFGIDVSAAAATSNISQFQISGGGTALVRCTHSTIYRIDNCPGAALQYWTVSAGSTADTWKMVEYANPTNYATFSVARLGGQKVFLLAGKLATDPMASVFRIGLSESGDWPAGVGYGSSAKGSWGRVDVLAAESFRNSTSSDGTTSTAHNIFGTMGTQGPLAMRAITNGAPTNTYYFAMQGARIFAIVGANDPATGGYLQINLMD